MLFSKQESYKRGIVASTLLNVVSKAIGFVNSLLLVYLFGTNFGTDTYFLTVATVSFVASFIAGMASYVVIPEAMRIRVNRNDRAEQGFINFFIWLFLAIGLLVALIVFCGPIFFYSLFSKYSATHLLEYRSVLLISSVLFPLNFIVTLLMLVISSHKYFTIPMIVSIINSIVSITLLFALKSTYGVTAAIIAFVTGFLINLLWLLMYMMSKMQWNFFTLTFPSVKNWQNILLMELNLIPVSFRSYITVYMLSGLGAGIITAYNYGMQIALIPEIMIISQVSAVVGIKINELSAKGNTIEINILFQRVMKLLFLTLLPVALLMLLLSEEIVEVLFMFKNKSDLQSVAAISAFMACFAVTLPFRVLDTLITNILTAQQKIKQGVVFAVILHTSVIIMTYFAVHLYGLNGFFLLIPFVYVFMIPVFYYFFTRRVLPFIQISLWLKQSGLFFALLVTIASGLFFLKKYFLSQYSLTVNILTISFVFLLFVFFVNRYTRYAKFSFSL